MLRNPGLLVNVTFNSLSYKNVRLGSVLSGKEELFPDRFGRLALILSINEKALPY